MINPISFFKVLLVLIATGSGYKLYHARLIQVGISESLIFYLGLFSLSCLVMFAVAFASTFRTRLFWAFLFSVAFIFGDASQRIMGGYLNYGAFMQLFDAKGFLIDALVQFGLPILTSLLIGLLLFVGLVLAPRELGFVPSRVANAIGGIMFFGLSVIVYASGGSGTGGLPQSYLFPPYLTIVAWEYLNGGYSEREPVTIPAALERPVRDLVLVVDESVRGDYLDINSPSGVRSGLQETYEGVAIVNLGLAVSIANCSTETNHGLRYGGKRDNYQEVLRTKPSLWSYAASAGMTTVYIDGQREAGDLQNNMDETGLQQIDHFIQFNGVDVLHRDLAIAKTLVDLLNNDIAELIYVNKVGAHFPVSDKYPKEYLHYKPALPRGKFQNIANAVLNENFGDRWDLYRNSYKNTLLWSVGKFFDELLPMLNLGSSVIIYTADHGQDFRERGNPGLNTHCSSEPNIEEGIVPLVLISGGDQREEPLPRIPDENVNRASHFNIFPTLLTLMGYRTPDIQAIYGPSLFEPSNDEQTFNTRFYTRLGKSPLWKKVDLKQLVNLE